MEIKLEPMDVRNILYILENSVLPVPMTVSSPLYNKLARALQLENQPKEQPKTEEPIVEGES